MIVRRRPRAGTQMAPEAPTTVVVVGPLPPPLNGAALIHHRVLLLVQGWCDAVITVDTTVRETRRGLRYHGRRLRLHVTAAAELIRLGRAGTLAAMYLTGAGGLAIWYHAVLVLTCRFFGFPVVYHHHSFAYLSRASSAMRTLSIGGADKVLHVVLCDGMRTALQTRYPSASRAAVCSNYAAVVAEGNEVPAAGDGAVESDRVPVVLGHLSNLCFDKGLDVVIDVSKRAVAAGYEAALSLAGPPADEAAASAVEAAVNDTASRVTYQGALQRHQVRGFLSDIDIFLFPSRYRNEAEPLVVLEAILAGTPVLVTDAGCLASLFQGTPWMAPRSEDFYPVLRNFLDQVQQHGDPAARRQYLREIAAVQQRLFASSDLDIVKKGLGL